MSAQAMENPVLDASKGVHRIWIAKNLTSNLDQTIKDYIGIKGLITTEILGNQLTIFSHESNYYFLISTGSAFYVSEYNLVTNHHVIKSALGENTKAFALKSLSPGGMEEVSVLWSDADKDLAILNAPRGSTDTIVFSNSEGIMRTLPVSSIGFPAASDQVSAGISDSQSYIEAVIQKGTLAAQLTRSGTGVKTWQHHAAISSGNSGGPIVNDCGQVVGINVIVHRQQQSTGLSVAIEEVIPELRRLSVPYVQESSICEGQAINRVLPQWSYLLLIIFFIVVLVVIIYLFQLKRKINQGIVPQSKSRLISDIIKRMQNGEHRVKVEDGHEWRKDDHERWYRFDPILGIIYKGDEKPEPPKEDAYIVLKHKEKEVKLYSGQSMTVGRASSADIFIANSYISSKHIKISFDGFFVTLIDLASKNGSFINNKTIKEEKINQNSLLELGCMGAEAELIDIVFPRGTDELKGEVIAILKPISDQKLPEITLRAGELVSVGRGENNIISINNKSLSAQHCFFKAHSDGQIILEDNDSSNGTFVDGFENKVTKTNILKGQQICLAVKEIVFEVS